MEIWRICLAFTCVICISKSDIIRNHEKEIVIDTETNLMWQDNNDSKTLQKNWYEAIEYCKHLKIQNIEKWRLPTIKELFTITDSYRQYPSIKQEFKNIENSDYWTISTEPESKDGAWGVCFSGNDGSWNQKNDPHHIRCVRNITTDNKQ